MELKLPTPVDDGSPTPLLIVPYGIETLSEYRYFSIGNLLIVPYGIETDKPVLYGFFRFSFNRTLWN